MTRFAFFALALSLAPGLLADLAPGQEKGGTKSDPLKTFEPRSKPGAGQKFLEKFVGDWDAVKTYHPRAVRKE